MGAFTHDVIVPVRVRVRIRVSSRANAGRYSRAYAC